MWGFGVDSCGEVTSLLNKRDVQLVDVLGARTFRKAFEQTNLKLLQFLFTNLLDLTDIALGKGETEGTEKGLELKRNAMFCFMTPSGQFTSQLTTCRPFLQKLNAFISGDSELSHEDVTRVCAILDFVVDASNGFVLLHFPDRGNLLRKLLKYVKHISAYNLLHFLSFSGLQVVTDFLVIGDAMNVLLEHLGNDPLLNERVFVLMSNIVRSVKPKSKLTEPFQKADVVEKLFKYCMSDNERTSVSALRLLTCLCNHFYESGNDSALIKLIGDRIPEFCEYIKKGERFTKSRSFALLILIRIVAFTRDLDVHTVLELLPGLLNRVINEPACTAVHSAFYELLKVAVTRKPEIVAELKLKQLIMNLYSKRDNMIANYWGFFHRITGLIIRWKVFDDYKVDGWDQFVETVYRTDEQICLNHYGGMLPNANAQEPEDEFPTMKTGGSAGGQKLSKPQFQPVAIRTTGGDKSESEEEDYDFDYDETEAEPPELQGEEIKWLYEKLIANERIKQKLSIRLQEIIVQDSPTELMAFSTNGQIIAIASGRELEVYRTSQFQALLLRTCTKSRIAAMAFTKDNSHLVVVGENDPNMAYYSLEKGKLEKTVTIEACDSASISSDCTKLACNKDLKTTVYNLETLEQIASFDYDKKMPIFTVFSTDGNSVATAYFGGHAQGYSLTKKSSQFRLKCHDKELTAMAISNNGTKVATASLDCTVKLWTISDDTKWRTFKAHRQVVNSLSLDSTQTWLISGSKDMNFNISNIDSGEMFYSVHSHIGNITCVLCAPNQPLFATASEDQFVKLWSMETTA